MLFKSLVVLERVSCSWSASRSQEILSSIQKCEIDLEGFIWIQQYSQKARVLHFLFIDLNNCTIFKMIENGALALVQLLFYCLIIINYLSLKFVWRHWLSRITGLLTPQYFLWLYDTHAHTSTSGVSAAGEVRAKVSLTFRWSQGCFIPSGSR